jgi:hypothetical protein
MTTKSKTSKKKGNQCIVQLPNGSIIKEPNLVDTKLNYHGIRLSNSIDFHEIIVFDHIYEMVGQTNTQDFNLLLKLIEYMDPDTNVVLLHEGFYESAVYLFGGETEEDSELVNSSLHRLANARLVSVLCEEHVMVNPLVAFCLPKVYEWVSEKKIQKQFRKSRDLMAKYFYSLIDRNNLIGQKLAKAHILALVKREIDSENLNSLSLY